jgi:hypothetical protein
MQLQREVYRRGVHMSQVQRRLSLFAKSRSSEGVAGTWGSTSIGSSVVWWILFWEGYMLGSLLLWVVLALLRSCDQKRLLSMGMESINVVMCRRYVTTISGDEEIDMWQLVTRYRTRIDGDTVRFFLVSK